MLTIANRVASSGDLGQCGEAAAGCEVGDVPQGRIESRMEEAWMSEKQEKKLSELTGEDILAMALEAIEDVPLWMEWTLPDLFRGYEWRQLDRASRRAASNLFEETMKARNDVFEFRGMKSARRYKKIDPNSYVMYDNSEVIPIIRRR